MWELSIKIALGNLNANASDVLAGIESLGAQELLVSALHALQVRYFSELHKEPFDRLLRESSPLVTVV